jgi:hypothetical protein
MLSLKVEIPPAVEPMELDFVKNALRVDVNDDDSLITAYMVAARRHVERICNRSLVNQKFRQTIDRFKHTHSIFDVGLASAEIDERWHDPNSRWTGLQEIKLLRSPLITKQITVTYYDLTQTLQTLIGPTPAWEADNIYSLGDQITDPNGNLQEVTAINEDEENEDGTASSGDDAPTWATSTTGSNTAVDNALTWTCKAIPAPAAQFQVDYDSEPPRIMPLYAQPWPEFAHVANAIQIRFWAGYGGDGDAVPEEAKVVILQLVANWYENRESVTNAEMREIPSHFEDLLAGIRVVDFAPEGSRRF